nr:MAG: capsid protein [Virus sp.]
MTYYYRKRGGIRRRMSFAKGNARYPRKQYQTLRSLNNIAEKKTVTTGSGSSNINSGGLIYNISWPQQGTQRGQRVGNDIFARYWRVNGYFNENQTSTPMVRMALLWPKRYDYALGDLPTTDYTQSFDLDKFTVIWDRLIPLATVNTASSTYIANSGGLSLKPFQYSIPIFKRFMFDDNNTTPQVPGPFFFFWSADLITPSPTVTYQGTLTFTDV